MAGKTPFFLTGANAKIKLDGRTMAFATDFSYSVEVVHATPQLLGMYEVANVEPMAYKVTGSMSVIRYAKNMKEFLESNGAYAPGGVNIKGNGVGAMEPGKGVRDIAKMTLGGGMHHGQAYYSLDPSKLSNAMKFDVELYQKGFYADKTQAQAFARLRDCRIVRVDGGVTKRGMATERWHFQAIYLDQDSFQAGMSGLGQQFL